MRYFPQQEQQRRGRKKRSWPSALIFSVHGNLHNSPSKGKIQVSCTLSRRPQDGISNGRERCVITSSTQFTHWTPLCRYSALPAFPLTKDNSATSSAPRSSPIFSRNTFPHVLQRITLVGVPGYDLSTQICGAARGRCRCTEMQTRGHSPLAPLQPSGLATDLDVNREREREREYAVQLTHLFFLGHLQFTPEILFATQNQ